MDWSKIQFFKPKEFDDREFPGSGKQIDEMTVWMLEFLRRKIGWPIIVLDAVDVRGVRHGENSFHNLDKITMPASAVDFYFKTGVGYREQTRVVLQSGFRGVGCYQRWAHPGFHVDRRLRYQIWKRVKGKYVYLLR